MLNTKIPPKNKKNYVMGPKRPNVIWATTRLPKPLTQDANLTLPPTFYFSIKLLERKLPPPSNWNLNPNGQLLPGKNQINHSLKIHTCFDSQSLFLFPDSSPSNIHFVWFTEGPEVAAMPKAMRKTMAIRLGKQRRTKMAIFNCTRVKASTS